MVPPAAMPTRLPLVCEAFSQDGADDRWPGVLLSGPSGQDEAEASECIEADASGRKFVHYALGAMLAGFVGLASLATVAACWDQPPAHPGKANERFLFEDMLDGVQQSLTNTTKDVIGTVCPTCHNASATDAKYTKLRYNSEGDWMTLQWTLAVYSASTAALLLVFSLLRRMFPLMFSYYATSEARQEEQLPFVPSKGLFGWVRDTLMMDNEEEIIGLDHAMLLEFLNLCIRLSLAIGAPMVLVLCPVHRLQDREGVDTLSKFGIGNLEAGSPWYLLHAGLVWYVVVAATGLIRSSQRDFIARRWRWMDCMPAPRATTVLVRAIPLGHRSDRQLEADFVKWFSRERVASASVIKALPRLTSLLAKYMDAARRLRSAKYQLRRYGKRPKLWRLASGGADAIDHYQDLTRKLKVQIQERRAEVQKGVDHELRSNSSSGFVTFRSRRDVQVALSLRFSEDKDEWVLSIPPEPEHVRYQALASKPGLYTGCAQATGHTCVILLFFLFTSLVATVAFWLEHLFIQFSNEARPDLASYAETLAPSVALWFMMSFLPTFLVLIFNTFFRLSSDVSLQHQIHVYYFWFQVIFVLLVAAIGQGLGRTFQEIIASPYEISRKLAGKQGLPAATHFYMQYLVLQWAVHATNILRAWNLMKYICFRPFHEKAHSRRLAEPEDQDYYGIGSRSARWTINMLIGLVFCQLCPIICILVLINFLLCKLIYGYLFVFTETRKPDAGGLFWVWKLRHLHYGLVIYIALMFGVLSLRSNFYAAWFAGSSILYLLWSYKRFEDLNWEVRPYNTIQEESKPTAEEHCQGSYVQPELRGLAEVEGRMMSDDFSDSDWSSAGSATSAEEEESLFSATTEQGLCNEAKLYS